jgi:hypothetical protein
VAQQAKLGASVALVTSFVTAFAASNEFVSMCTTLDREVGIDGSRSGGQGDAAISSTDLPDGQAKTPARDSSKSSPSQPKDSLNGFGFPATTSVDGGPLVVSVASTPMKFTATASYGCCFFYLLSFLLAFLFFFCSSIFQNFRNRHNV